MICSPSSSLSQVTVILYIGRGVPRYCAGKRESLEENGKWMIVRAAEDEQSLLKVETRRSGSTGASAHADVSE